MHVCQTQHDDLCVKLFPSVMICRHFQLSQEKPTVPIQGPHNMYVLNFQKLIWFKKIYYIIELIRQIRVDVVLFPWKRQLKTYLNHRSAISSNVDSLVIQWTSYWTGEGKEGLFLLATQAQLSKAAVIEKVPIQWPSTP